jgi:CRISPR-associated protein Cas2
VVSGSSQQSSIANRQSPIANSKSAIRNPQSAMQCLLVYDIPEDKIRSKVADICLDYGLARIQYSAFLGEMNHNRQEEILQKIRRRVGKHAANVQLFPICEKDLGLRKELSVGGYGFSVPSPQS